MVRRHHIIGVALLVGLVSCASSDSTTPTSNAGGTGGTGGVGATGGSGSSGSAGASNVTTISVIDDAYDPPVDTVTAGTQVTWSWSGYNYSAHSVTFADGPTSSIQQTGTYSRTFTVVGTYTYDCMVHGTAMTGTIVVH